MQCGEIEFRGSFAWAEPFLPNLGDVFGAGRGRRRPPPTAPIRS